MNKERLIELRDFLANNPGRFNYKTFCGRDLPRNEDEEKSPDYFDTGSLPKINDKLIHDCKTVGCVAGWTVALFATEEDLQTLETVSVLAGRLLELGSFPYYQLFDAENYREEDGGLSVALSRLDHLIEKGE